MQLNMIKSNGLELLYIDISMSNLHLNGKQNKHNLANPVVHSGVFLKRSYSLFSCSHMAVEQQHFILNPYRHLNIFYSPGLKYCYTLEHFEIHCYKKADSQPVLLNSTDVCSKQT